ncbi:hypothetical protein METBIDRAFT_26841, partial [Metschnikowia bicuspidata var. bicuspidata NRRL YB-4993]
SRKGCLSCKKLKIKCDEAKPCCEYCSHTGRVCVYPDQRISYKASINSEIKDCTDKDPAAGHVLRPRPYNLAVTQLQMTRFELRLLHLFHDQCVPYVTFQANKHTHRIWRHVFPKHFASLDLVRQSTYAMACLYLWPMANLQTLLQADQQESPGQTGSLEDLLFTHVFEGVSVFEDSAHSIFRKTASYFISSLQSSQLFLAEKQHGLDYDDFAALYFSGYLIFAYVGVHPHCVLPLLEDGTECPLDYIGFFASLHRLFSTAPLKIRDRLVDTLVEYSIWTPTAASQKIGLVETLRFQLPEFHFANATFGEIGPQMCLENETLEKTLYLFESCYFSAIREGHPTPLFKFLVLLGEDFINLARLRNYFALRILFTFSCVSI